MWYYWCCDYGSDNGKAIVKAMISRWADEAEDLTSQLGWWAKEASLADDVNEAGDAKVAEANEADKAKANDAKKANKADKAEAY